MDTSSFRQLTWELTAGTVNCMGLDRDIRTGTRHCHILQLSLRAMSPHGVSLHLSHSSPRVFWILYPCVCILSSSVHPLNPTEYTLWSCMVPASMDKVFRAQRSLFSIVRSDYTHRLHLAVSNPVKGSRIRAGEDFTLQDQAPVTWVSITWWRWTGLGHTGPWRAPHPRRCYRQSSWSSHRGRRCAQYWRLPGLSSPGSAKCSGSQDRREDLYKPEKVLAKKLPYKKRDSCYTQGEVLAKNWADVDLNQLYLSQTNTSALSDNQSGPVQGLEPK